MYKLDATGFPVCPTCSLWGLQPISLTGFEHAVAAPKNALLTLQSFPNFQDLLSPLPPETTISASAMVILSVALSTETTSTFTPKSEIEVRKSFTRSRRFHEFLN